VAYALLVQGCSVWKLRQALKMQRTVAFPAWQRRRNPLGRCAADVGFLDEAAFRKFVLCLLLLSALALIIVMT